MSNVIPRSPGDTYDCTDCPWQGKHEDTDAGVCPECGAEVEKYVPNTPSSDGGEG
jgi:predicted RNA-binding Zn-ribbon protein involved in translation (DUF1610 family)